MYDNIHELEAIIEECDLYKEGPNGLYNWFNIFNLIQSYSILFNIIFIYISN